MRGIIETRAFKKNFKRIAARDWPVEKLKAVTLKLACDAPHTELFKDHALKGEWAGKRECHVTSITDDWLLVYEKPDAEHLVLHGTGTHADLFE